MSVPVLSVFRWLSGDTKVGRLPSNSARSLTLPTESSAVPDRDSCNLLTLVATMIVNSVQALLLARDRFHPLQSMSSARRSPCSMRSLHSSA